MQSLAYIPGSNGTLSASLMTVTAPRTYPAITNSVNTLSGVPTRFYGVMGAPHTFTDPATGEVITIVSEATAVEAAFVINAGKIDIVAIAPGYSDARGSAVGDIIVVRPTTEWANNIFNLLSQSLNDDGTIKTTALDYFFKPTEIFTIPFVASGGVIAQTTLLTASFSDISFYIGGFHYTKTGVANRVYTVSKDTYVDIDNTGTLYYTEVANGATTGMTLTAGRIRLAKVVTNGTTITSVVQYGVDPLGNDLYNNRPTGYRAPWSRNYADAAGQGFTQNVEALVTGTQHTLVTKGGRVVVLFAANAVFTAAGTATFNVWVDGVSKGGIAFVTANSPQRNAVGFMVLDDLPAGSHTVEVRLMNTGGASQGIQFNSNTCTSFEVRA